MGKFYILLIVMFLSVNGFSQNKKQSVVDTNQMCIPYSVAQKILLDLNDYDRLKEVVITYNNEIYELNNKILILKKENEVWKQQDKLNSELIVEKDKAIAIYTSENGDLKKENKRLKTKNGLYNIISGLIIVPLTYIIVSK
jgi:hypothetical protein